MSKQPEVIKKTWAGAGVAFFVVLAWCVFNYFTWRQTELEMRSELEQRTQQAAEVVDAGLLRDLTGTQSDLHTREYQALKNQLMLLHQVFPESRFLYLMGKRPDGTVYFFVDSEPLGSPDVSPPGQVYGDVTTPLLDVFRDGQTRSEGPVSDAWGTWISALTPIKDPIRGKVLAVFGMDVDARDWKRLIIGKLAPTMIMSAALAAAVLGSYFLLRWRAVKSTQSAQNLLLSHAETIVVLVVGLLLTGLVALQSHKNEEVSRIVTFERIAAVHSSSISKQLQDVENYQLEGLARFFESSVYVDREEFRQYTSALTQASAVQSWQWIPVLAPQDLNLVEQQARQEGLKDFHFWEFDEDGKPRPLTARAYYYPVTYAAPLEANLTALGYDLGSDAARRPAIERALKTGAVSASGGVQPVLEQGDQREVLVLRPVFARPDGNTQTGLVAAVVSMQSVLEDSLSLPEGGLPSLYIDLYQLEAGVPAQFLAGNSPDEIVAIHTQENFGGHLYSDFDFIQPITAFGNMYAVMAHPGLLFRQLYPARAGWITAIYGLLSTGLLTLLVFFLVSRREALATLVAERTAALTESEANYRELFEAESDAIFLIDNESGQIIQANQAASAMYGFENDALLSLRNTDLSAEPEKTREATRNYSPDPGRIVTIPLRWHRRKDGAVFPVEITARHFTRQGRSVHVCAIRDISERLAAEETLRLQGTALQSAANAIIITDLSGKIQWANPAFSKLTGYSVKEALGKKPGELLKSGLQDEAFYRQMWATIIKGQIWRGEVINRRKDGSLYSEEMTITPVKTKLGEISHFIAIKQDISERKQREEELQAIASMSAALRSATTRADMLSIVLDQLTRLLKLDGAALIFQDHASAEAVVEAASGEFRQGLRTRVPPGEGISGKVLSSGQPFVTADIRQEPGVIWNDVFKVVHAVACIPMVVESQTIGVLWAGQQTEFQPGEIRLLTSIADIAANAIHRERLREETLQQLERMATLRAIDQVLASNVDVKVTLNFILKQLTAQLGVDAAAILLNNPHSLTLEYAAGHGFTTREIEHSIIRIGEDVAGRAAAAHTTIHIADLQNDHFNRKELVKKEGLVSYLVTPLVVKWQVKGVLEIFQRSRLDLRPDWVDYFETLAGQAAIAIDNAQLFEGLERSNLELTLAYDATIEGWSRAMDLRDTETEGHTQRVTDLAVRLARAAGMSEEHIAHLRRGALLHDMGKLGIPDSILLKPGPLDEQEWEIMRTHPVLARDMLEPIAYLRPALDIPYCHHEKWDGSGYPRGLKGQEIPLAARIFAVVDVYDALTSDRPYRPAWTKEAALAYIREQSGAHFDPRMVDLFLQIVV